MGMGKVYLEGEGVYSRPETEASSGPEWTRDVHTLDQQRNEGKSCRPIWASVWSLQPWWTMWKGQISNRNYG